MWVSLLASGLWPLPLFALPLAVCLLASYWTAYGAIKLRSGMQSMKHSETLRKRASNWRKSAAGYGVDSIPTIEPPHESRSN
jgi:hypothetical protein